jgi:hypothetical protein
MPVSRLLATVGFVGCLGLTWWLGHRDLGGSGGAEHVGGLKLTERGEAVGLAFRHVPFVPDPKLAHIEPQVSATGAGVSVADVDGDGWMDVFATTSAGGTPCGLFLNDGQGAFRDVAAQAGLADLAVEGTCAPMGSLWADVDGDGDQDVFVYAYGESRLMEQLGADPVPTFREAGAASGMDRWMNANGATWIDYDNDGALDLYVCGYFREDTDLWSLTDTDVMHDSFEFAENGGDNRLWRNTGGLAFDDVTAATGTSSTRWTYAAVAADLDADGWVDLYLANDFGSEELLRNEEGARFRRMEGLGLDADSKSGMCVAVGDATNQGRTSLFVTNISERGFLFQGNNLRINLLPEGGPMLEVGSGHVADCGWAWGAQFVDLDNDGWQDLFVANGFVSADPERSYWYDMAKIGGAVDSLVQDASHWPDMDGRSLSGYERSRVLRNLGRQGFRDVGEAAGVDDRYDGRAVAVADLFGDGAPDVLVANQGGPLLLYSNEPAPDRHWVAFELEATGGHREALGATLTVRFGEHTQLLSRVSASGFCAQNDPRLHVGLGDRDVVDSVLIRWPSGTRQELTDLPADRVHRIVEPVE